jgi:DNA-binding response OmpR family regulator
MQTSVLTPLSLYASDPADSALLLEQLPERSESVDALEALAKKRRCLISCHDQTSALQASEWVNQQSSHRQSQIAVILPAEATRISPQCYHFQRPFQLPQLLHFLKTSKILPELPEKFSLTETESALLEQLYCADDPVEHDQLLAQIWGYEKELETHTLETHLYRLRKKLEKTKFQIVTKESRYQLLSSEG